MTNVYKKILVLSGVVGISILSLNYSSGPALNFQSVTGASFGTYGAGVYCNNCHSGGSFNTAATTLQLLSNNVPVTGNYVPGWNYTLRITRGTNASHNALANAGFGFQVTCVVDATNTNVNTWGSPLPTNTANRTLSSRNYIEHTTKLSKTITTVDIPWTAPTGNLGTVKFYLALNNVNGDGNNTGDNPAAFTATFTQAPLPVTWLYFRGKESGTANLLEWGVSYEAENDFYIVEKSDDGVNFSKLGEVKATHDPVAIHTYSLADAAPYTRTYYRIKSIDINGGEIFYKTIQIVRPVGISFTHIANDKNVILKVSSDHEKDLVVTMFGMDGRKISSQKVFIGIGENEVVMERPSQSGLFLLYVSDNGELVYRSKFYNSL